MFINTLLPSDADWQKFILGLDADLKDPLTIIKFTLGEITENAADEAARESFQLLSMQVERIVQILRANTDLIQKLPQKTA